MVIKSEKKVSVIIPVYNAGQFLDECLASIVTQTYKNLEILIIDDGSTDKSVDICSKYADVDSRVRYIYQENSGVSKARNKGLELFEGDYVTFVDADDTLRIDAIQLMASLMLESGTDCVRTKCDVRNDRETKVLSENVTLGAYAGNELHELALMAATGRLMCFTWLLMIKRDVIVRNKLRFPVGVLMMEDMWFYIDMLRSISSILISETITYNYVVRDSGATRSLSSFDDKLDSIAKVNRHVSGKYFNHDEMAYINAIHAGNMVNFTIINAVRLKKIREVYNLLGKICFNKDFANLYIRADYSKWGRYYKAACKAAYDKNRTLLLAIVISRKIIRR